MTCGFGLLWRIVSPRFVRVEKISRWFVHTLRITDPEELDDEVFRWLKEAYEVGEQRHLDSRGRLNPPRKALTPETPLTLHKPNKLEGPCRAMP